MKFIFIQLCIFLIWGCSKDSLNKENIQQLNYAGDNMIAEELVKHLNCFPQLSYVLTSTKPEQLLLDQTIAMHDRLLGHNYAIPIRNENNEINSCITFQTNEEYNKINSFQIVNIETLKEMETNTVSNFGNIFLYWQQQQITITAPLLQSITTHLEKTAPLKNSSSRADSDPESYTVFEVSFDYEIFAPFLTFEKFQFYVATAFAATSGSSSQFLNMIERYKIDLITTNRIAAHVYTTSPKSTPVIRAYLSEVIAEIRSTVKSFQGTFITSLEYVSGNYSPVFPPTDEDKPKPEPSKCIMCNETNCQLEILSPNDNFRSIMNDVRLTQHIFKDSTRYADFCQKIEDNPLKIYGFAAMYNEDKKYYRFQVKVCTGTNAVEALALQAGAKICMIYYPLSYMRYPTIADLLFTASTGCQYHYNFIENYKYALYIEDVNKAKEFYRIYSNDDGNLQDITFAEGTRFRADWDYATETLFHNMSSIHCYLHSLAYVMEKNDSGMQLLIGFGSGYYIVSAHQGQMIKPTLYTEF